MSDSHLFACRKCSNAVAVTAYVPRDNLPDECPACGHGEFVYVTQVG